jgi:hypothetical protein
MRIQRSLLTVDPAALLAAFLKNVNEAGFATIEDPVALAHSIRELHAALLLAAVAQSHETDPATPQFADIYPVIERAVMGS